MKYGFSFKGTHTKEFQGLTVKTASRPIKPEMRNQTFTAPFADGAVSAADKNPYGREFYEGRVFTMVMTLTAPDFPELNARLEKISVWLMGSGELIFDDSPLISWDARAVGSVDYAPERAGTRAILSAAFEVSPFGRLVWRAPDGPEISRVGIRLGDQIPIGADAEGYMKDIAEDKTERMVINNYGDAHVRPIITIRALNSDSSARIGTVTLEIPGKASMTISGGSQVKTAIADCGRHIVTDENGNVIFGRAANQVWISGGFLELPPGRSSLYVSRTAHAGSGGVSVAVDFAPAYMWSTSVNDIDWG